MKIATAYRIRDGVWHIGNGPTTREDDLAGTRKFARQSGYDVLDERECDGTGIRVTAL